MIKILTGWSNVGGSTTAFINLTNLLNKNGIDCIMYGPHDYHLNKCESGSFRDVTLQENDNIIIHFFDPQWSTRPPLKGKVFYSCHEKDIRPIKSFNYKIFDKIHYVAEHQRDWHNANHPNFIIENVLDDLKPNSNKPDKVAGIIGTVDPNKQVEVSIQKAVDDGMNKIIIFGKINDTLYYREKVEPLVKKYNVILAGHIDDKQGMYDSISDVYHSSKSECLSYVRNECNLLGINFHGNESTNKKGYDNYPTNQQILEKWKKELEV